MPWDESRVEDAQFRKMDSQHRNKVQAQRLKLITKGIYIYIFMYIYLKTYLELSSSDLPGFYISYYV